MNAYLGKLLYVDLTSGEISTRELPSDEIPKKYLGCFGLGLRFLYDMLPPGFEATDPENHLIFMTGPLTGLHLPLANQLTVTTKNFDTGFTVGRSHTHGFLVPRLKWAGYDGLIVTGRAPAPVYLWIHDGQVEIKDAGKLWGRDTHETEDLVREEVGEVKASVATIGPAGDNLCAGALMENDKNHSASHAVGGVMGSKKLKAIAVFGSHQTLDVYDSNKLQEVNKRWREVIMNAPAGAIQWMRNGGVTRNDYAVVQKATGVSSHNWRRQLPEFGRGMSQHKITPRPCWSCPIACSYDVEVLSVPHKGYVASLSGGGETMEASGILGITEPGTVFYLTDLLARLGIDGGTAGFTMAMASP